jgi:hypothetical protein
MTQPAARPLVISDCDEVILHMVGPFGAWLEEEHGVAFHMGAKDFGEAVRRIDTGAPVGQDEVWRLLNLFFDTQMHRQTPIAGAVPALHRLAEGADVVVLTNLLDHRQAARTRQLADHGIPLRVFTNQGPKGPALKAIIDEYRPSRAVFIDDLALHLGSVAKATPQVARLHLCGEPRLAPHIPCAHQAGDAHARIDSWDHALPWLMDRLHGDDR